jgi:hypothetical protein
VAVLVKAKRPAWTRRVLVHVVVEAFDLGSQAAAVRAELYARAPHAYTAKTLLWVIWRLLSPDSRTAIERAWKVELEGAPLRSPRAGGHDR